MDADQNKSFYDTDGNFTFMQEIDYYTKAFWEPVIKGAKDLAAQESEDWDIGGPSFVGVSSLGLNGNVGAILKDLLW